MDKPRLSFFETIAFAILFVPFFLIDLFHVANETTEYERRCANV